MKAAGEAWLKEPGALAMLQLCGIHDEENPGGLKIGDRGQVVDKLRALMLADLGLPKFVERIDDHHSPDGALFRCHGFLDGAGPTTHRNLPQPALGQLRIEVLRCLRRARRGPPRDGSEKRLQNGWRAARGQQCRSPGPGCRRVAMPCFQRRDEEPALGCPGPAVSREEPQPVHSAME